MNFKKNIWVSVCLLIVLNQSYVQARALILNPLKQEIEKVIALLCLKFKMTNDIDIKFLSDERMDDAVMGYCGKISTVIVSDTIEERYPLSMIYMILLHEFRHHIQHQHKMCAMRTGKAKLARFYDPCVLKEAHKRKNVLWFPDDSLPILFSDYIPINKEQEEYVKMIQKLHKKNPYDQIFKPTEFDADLFSIKQVSCPICYDITLCRSFNKDISEEGYVGLDFRKKYRPEKQKNPCCKAHRFKDSQKYKEAFDKLIMLLDFAEDDSKSLKSSKYIQELCKVDKQFGPLSDRYTS